MGTRLGTIFFSLYAWHCLPSHPL